MCATSRHILFTFLSFATCSTISLEITIASFSPPSPVFTCRRSPHSRNAKATSSGRIFVAFAMSNSVHLTLRCVVALPVTGEIVVWVVRRDPNVGSNREGRTKLVRRAVYLMRTGRQYLQQELYTIPGVHPKEPPVPRHQIL